MNKVRRKLIKSPEVYMRRCSNCIFGDICPECHVCNEYAPVDDSLDVSSPKELQDDYDEFVFAWREYIDEFYR